MTNAAMMMICTNWIVECNFREKWQKLKSNKSILIFCAIFVVHLIWLINTSNFGYAVNDLRIKLPIFVLPIIFGTSQTLTQKKLHLVLASFIAGVFVATLIGLFARLFADRMEFRDFSLFVSHIRLSLMICLSVFVLIYFVAKRIYFTNKTAWIAVILALWLLMFMSMVQSITGFACFGIVAIILLIVVGIKTSRKLFRWLCFSSVVLIFLIVGGTITYFVNDFYTPTCENIQLEKTANGTPYDEVKSDGTIENGNVVWLNVSKKELTEAWTQRSDIPIDSLDNRGQSLYSTLVRYMTSLGLTKDAEGVAKLSDNDVKNIENGETNYRFAGNGGLINRIYVVIWELDVYKKLGDCNGHSVTQRIEYLKYGLKIIEKNFWTGVGVGDVQDEYFATYDDGECSLQIENQHRAHNQFITFFISFGLVGFLICVFAWFYPAISKFATKEYLFGVFFIIATISMFTDDTLETSTGAVFVAFFYSLLKWSWKNKSIEKK